MTANVGCGDVNGDVGRGDVDGDVIVIAIVGTDIYVSSF